MDESRSVVNPDVGATEFSDINAAEDQIEPLRFEEEKSHAVEASSESEGEQSNGSTPIVESQPLLETKRVRKKVQRLSETLSKAHEEKAEQKAQAAKEISASLQAGKGTELGAIPLIEDSFRKTKPVNLKPLHLIVYGRLGAVNEVRSNLRKFRGFGFGPGSPEYTKKVSSIQQRPTNEIREVLRLLHLEVSGTREVMATRLMDFLLRPSASLVKYKGKIVKKSGKGKTSGGKKRSSKKSASKSASTEASSENASHPDEDSMESDVSSSESEEPVAPKPPKKRTNPQKKENGVKPPAKKRAVLDDSVSDISDDEPKSSKVPQTLTQSGADSDSDVPLSNLTSKKKAAYPSDQELKSSIIDLLKTVDLEQTSLKVVREQLFSRYPGLDLSDKKEFINTTVKEYLAQA